MAVSFPRLTRKRRSDAEIVELALRRVWARPLNRQLAVLGALLAPLEIFFFVEGPHRFRTTVLAVGVLAAIRVPAVVRGIRGWRHGWQVTYALRRGDVDAYRDAARCLDQAGERVAAQAAFRVAQSRCTDPPQIAYYASQARRLDPVVDPATEGEGEQTSMWRRVRARVAPTR